MLYVCESTSARGPYEAITKPFFYHKRMFPKDIVYTVAINLSNFLNSSSWNLSKWMGQSWEHVNVIFSMFPARGKILLTRAQESAKRTQGILSTIFTDESLLIKNKNFITLFVFWVLFSFMKIIIQYLEVPCVLRIYIFLIS